MSSSSYDFTKTEININSVLTSHSASFLDGRTLCFHNWWPNNIVVASDMVNRRDYNSLTSDIFG